MARVNILSVRAQHAFAYEDVSFDFTSGIHSITGDNGTSKSSLFMVLSQCFYNKNPKDIKVPDVSNDVTCQPFEIETELEVDDVRYRVINSKKGSGKISIFKDGASTSCAPKGIPASLAMIADLLRADYTTFVDMCYRSNKSTLDILEEAGDAKRKKFIEGILDFNLLDEKLAAAKQKAKDHADAIELMEKKHSVLNSSIIPDREVLDQQLTEPIRGKILATEEVIEGHVANIATLKAHKSTLVGQLTEAQESAKMQERIIFLANKLDGFSSDYESLQDAQASDSAVAQALARIDGDTTHAHSALRKLKKPKAPELTCSKCGHDLGMEEAQSIYEDELGVYESDHRTHSAALARATSEGQHLRNEKDKTELQVTKWEAKIRLESEQKNLMARCMHLGDYDSLETEIDAISSNLSNEEIALSRDRVMLLEWESDLRTAEAHNTTQQVNKRLNKESAVSNGKNLLERDSLTKDIAAEDVLLGLAKEWVHHYGPKGMRVHKMQQFLQLLNDRMSKYSDMVCGGSIQCTFYVDDAGKIEVLLLDSDKSKPYANWSDGEKERVKTACLFAILEILGIKGDCSFNVLFLDEVFGALDEAGREGLFRTFEYLKDQGSCVYTIAHTPIANKVTYDSTYLATKLEGISTICEVQSAG